VTLETDTQPSDLYREIETLNEALRQPGTGQISDAAEVHVSPDGTQAVFAGVVMDKLEGTPPTRIAVTDLVTGDTRVLTFGPNVDRLPKFSPDGRQIAFLSDRRSAGDFQFYLLDPVSGAARATPAVEGWVEYLHWSPDGKRILLGVAGHGADIAGGQGAVTSKQVARDAPAWMPAVETGDERYRWRRAWVYELATDRVRQVSKADSNIWEAAWCGNDALVAVVSPGPSEGLWYSARLCRIEIETSNSRELYQPQDQLGWPATSPSGQHVAIVEALCSDRWFVAGDLRLIDIITGRVLRVDTGGVDITYTEWRSNRHLLLAGHRGFETVVGLYEVTSGTFKEVWSSQDLSTGGMFVSVSGFGKSGECVFIGESFLQAPEIAVIRQGEYHAVKSFDLGYSEQVKAIDAVERVMWPAPDGLEIHGWLLRPKGIAPHPVILSVHGGPVGHTRPTWLGRRAGAPILMLVKRGYGVFFTNPRGSAGRGQEFARRVYKDMGGAETEDHLSGLDYLVERGVADPARLGVTGGSHGGFMTSWIITQDSRFAAAVPIAPVTNYVTQYLISNIPQFLELFFVDSYQTPGGQYVQRSPVMHAHQVKTPTLNICGALDRCTPPEEAVQFHNALLQNGVESVLVTYPEEGHGIRKFPAALDCTARMIAWFETYMPARAASGIQTVL
jgi:dipeptidyl aminopeptidase/acylaminoacyl peptidase